MSEDEDITMRLQAHEGQQVVVVSITGAAYIELMAIETAEVLCDAE